MTAPHPEGLGAYSVMKNCLEDAGVTPDEVDHINMHGTSTPLEILQNLMQLLNY